MQTIDEIQMELIQAFWLLGDSFERYAYLLVLGMLLPAMDPAQKTPENMVAGCQSHVWLDICVSDGVFQFDADSDTLIIKGVLYLLREIFCGQHPEDVASAEVFFLRETGLMDTFESARQKGIGCVIRALRDAAAAYA